MVSELGGWYTRSVPEMGFYVQERLFGFYQLQKDPGRVRATVRHLRGGQGRFLLARVAGEPASVLAFYEGEDRFVHPPRHARAVPKTGHRESAHLGGPRGRP